MNTETLIQAIGYFSTVLILISFLMTSVVKLRLLNLAGSIVFVIFAFLTKSYPTAIMNIGLCIINIYFLIRLIRAKRLTTVLPIELDSPYLKTFLDFYRADIHTYFPVFSAETFDGDMAYFVYYDLNPVGLTMGKRQENGELELCLDYAIPKYRDASVGRFLYPHLLGEEGFSALTFPNCSDKHESYLKQMGFRKVGGCYRLEQ